MPICPLPNDPSFEHLKGQAKRLLKEVGASNPLALAVVREFHPRAAAALAEFKLADAQLVVARGYGLPSWPKLKLLLAEVERHLFDPPDAVAIGDASADDLVRLACVNYGDWDPSRAARARALDAAHPEIARSDLYAAAAVGDVATVRAFLDRDRSLVSRKGGALRWEPLLYACYSRFDGDDRQRSTLGVARLLLERGADPNAGFLWRGAITPFTALTGAFGGGEDGNNQPPHRESLELAKLLLDAGADPNDGQTLYNRHFRPEDDHLELLLKHGLGKGAGGLWYRRLGERLGTPAALLVEELWAAAGKNYFERVKLLVAHGVDVNAPGFRDGRTPFEAAMRSGNREIADYLVAHGARRVELDPGAAFAAACVRGDREGTRALLAKHPGLLEALGESKRTELVHAAVEARRPDGLRLMAELGFNLSGLSRNTALHQAAWAGDVELVELLLELGADPNVREPTYDATPLGWAEHNHQLAVVEVLRRDAERRQSGGMASP